MARFRRWMGLAEVEPAQECSSLDAVRLATHEMKLWKGTAVLVGQTGDWTVFEDLSGALQTCDAQELLSLAIRDELVLAAYNDAMPYGRLVVLVDGEVVRDFCDEPDDPEFCWDRGTLADESERPIRSWIDVASRVDDLELDFVVDHGTLMIFGQAGS